MTSTPLPVSPISVMSTTIPPNPNTTTGPYVPVFPSSDKCNYYIVNQTSYHWLDFGNPYGGIPQNLLINAIGFIVLLLLFAILRRTAGNYGRLALIRKDDDESGWAQIFYSEHQGGDDSSREDDYEEATFEGIGPESGDTDSITTADYSEVDRGMCSWILSVFTLSDDMILRRCGIDALQYIRFQRHLLVFMFIITVVCVSIILPINFTMGNIQGGKQNFGHTTISNLPGTASVLWVHIVLGILFMPLGIFIMRRFSVSLRMEYEEDNSVSSRTLMLDGIPVDYCKKDYIIRHFQEAYPSCEIDDVQIAFSVSKLTSLTEKLETAQRAIKFCENYHRKSGGKHLKMNPNSCGLLCSSFSGCGDSSCVTAIDYYKDQEKNFKHSVDFEKSQLQSNAIGIAFVTFSNLSDAKRINRDHRKIVSCLNSNPASSSLDSVLNPAKWDVRFAPPPEDIYWENLNRKKHFRTLKVWMVNIILFLVLFFFTSPAYIMSVLETFPFLNAKDFAKDLKNNLPVYITDFLPTLLLWTLSALLPVMVAYSDWWLGHWRRSVENLWIMRKVFGYLLFMILILPSIGQTTVRAFLEGIINKNKENDDDHPTINWECIFLPDNGAFFVNYVTTCALIGTGLEIIRFPELFMYAVRLGSAKSKAEISSVRKAIVYEFPFGVNYAWMLLVFALTVSYSVICPLITPFGLFYFLMKHAVDRYNIYFAYKRSKINKNIHGCAVNCVCISLLIQQLMLLFFNTIRSKNETLLPPRAIFSITMFTIFCLLFMAQMFFHAFKGISPIQYTITSPNPQHYSGADTASTSSATSGLSAFARQNVRNRKFLPDVIRNFES